jgi:hypothetical protein
MSESYYNGEYIEETEDVGPYYDSAFTWEDFHPGEVDEEPKES